LRGSDIEQRDIEIKWAEMVAGVEQERLTAKSVGFLDKFRGTLDRNCKHC
jgi:hypothetical protein